MGKIFRIKSKYHQLLKLTCIISIHFIQNLCFSQNGHNILLTDLYVNGEHFELDLSQPSIPSLINYGDNIIILGRIEDNFGNLILNESVSIQDGLGYFSTIENTGSLGYFSYSTVVLSDGSIKGPREILFYIPDVDYKVIMFLIDIPETESLLNESHLDQLANEINNTYGIGIDLFELNIDDGEPLYYGPIFIPSYMDIEEVTIENYYLVLNQAMHQQTNPWQNNPEIWDQAYALRGSEKLNIVDEIAEKFANSTGPAKIALYVGGGALCVSTPFTHSFGASGCVLVTKMFAIDFLKYSTEVLMEKAGADEVWIELVSSAIEISGIITSDETEMFLTGFAYIADEIYFYNQVDKPLNVLNDAFEFNANSILNPSILRLSDDEFYMEFDYLDEYGNLIPYKYQFIISNNVILQNGQVNPPQGTTSDNYTFNVIYTDPLNQPPQSVSLKISSNTYQMTGSGTYSNGVTFSKTLTFSSPGTYSFYFEALTANGQTLRWPEASNLTLTVNQSSSGWEIRVMNLTANPTYLVNGGSVSCNATVHNDSDSPDKIYYNVPYIFEMLSPTGTLIDSKSGVIPILAQSNTVNISKTLTTGSTHGNYILNFSINPTIDNNWSNNTLAKTIIVGQEGPAHQYYVSPNYGNIFLGESPYPQCTIFNGAEYCVNVITNDYIRIRRNLESQQTINNYDFKEFNSYQEAVLNNHTSTIGTDYVMLSFGIANQSIVTFPLTQIAGFRGDEVSFVANSSSSHFTSSTPMFYRNPDIFDWYSHLNLSNGNQTVSFTFDIPNNAEYGIHEFYMGCSLSQEDELFLRKLVIEVKVSPPHISSLSSYIFSADDQLTIFGSDFGSTQGTVQFFNNLNASVISWTNTQIDCIVPDDTQSGNLNVTASSNGTSNGMSYTIVSSTGDPEIIQPIPDQSMYRNSELIAANLYNTFWDPNNDPLIFNAESSSENIICNIIDGSLILNSNQLAQGAITITVTATDITNASVEDLFVINIQGIPLNANFHSNTIQICSGETVTFYDLSSGDITSWQWTFEGGIPSSYNGQTPPPVQYNNVGAWDVTLTVSNSTSSDTETKIDYVTVNEIMWTGNISNDWNDPGNWSNNALPGINSIIVIPGSAANQPILNNDATCNKLILKPGSELLINYEKKLIITDSLIIQQLNNSDPSKLIIRGEVWANVNAGEWQCGDFVIINHIAGAVAPVDKTVIYGTVTSIPGEPFKCWMTRNLGADSQATSVDDASEGSAGWYWQFNRMQGYKHDGTTRTPNSAWIEASYEPGWLIANDPCAIEIGNGWRLPTSSEWFNVCETDDPWTSWEEWSGPWNSGLKLHAAGQLDETDGSLIDRGVIGNYWSNTRDFDPSAHSLLFDNSNCIVNYFQTMANGLSIRCIRDNENCIPDAPGEGTHLPSLDQIEWHWNSVENATGYLWNVINDFVTAMDMGDNTTFTESELDGNTLYIRYAWAYNDCGHSPPVILTQFTTSEGEWQCGESIEYDGQYYNTIQIGSQCWLKENLNVGTRIDASQNQGSTNGIIEKYCYNDLESNCDIYGALYQWDELMQGETSPGSRGICPEGWHIPSKAEWETLVNYVGGDDVAGTKLKESGTNHWSSPNTGTNESGFTAFGGGVFVYEDGYYYLNSDGIWSSSELYTEDYYHAPWYLLLMNDWDYSEFGTITTIDGRNCGYSVRCLKD